MRRIVSWCLSCGLAIPFLEGQAAQAVRHHCPELRRTIGRWSPTNFIPPDTIGPDGIFEAINNAFQSFSITGTPGSQISAVTFRSNASVPGLSNGNLSDRKVISWARVRVGSSIIKNTNFALTAGNSDPFLHGSREDIETEQGTRRLLKECTASVAHDRSTWRCWRWDLLPSAARSLS